MAENEKQTNKERLKDITDSIKRGIEELFQSDKYAEYSASDYLDLFVFRYSFRYSVGSTCVTSLNALENFPCVSYPT